MLDKYIYKFLDFVMEWSGKINSWAWVKHLKYVEKKRFKRYHENNGILLTKRIALNIGYAYGYIKTRCQLLIKRGGKK